MVTNYSGQKWSVVAKTGNYTALTTDFLILCDATTADFQVTLPAAVDGICYMIKKTTAPNTVQVIANGVETIDGSITVDIVSQYDCMMIVAEDGDWYIV